MKDEIRALADRYAAELKRNIDGRMADMEQDDRSHVLIYEVLGISREEGKLIDVYQNKGRFLYKYAGSFLEEAAKLCFKAKFPDSGSVRVPNTHGKKPKLFGVDCLVGSDALEIKWRDEPGNKQLQVGGCQWLGWLGGPANPDGQSADDNQNQKNNTHTPDSEHLQPLPQKERERPGIVSILPHGFLREVRNCTLDAWTHCE